MPYVPFGCVYDRAYTCASAGKAANQVKFYITLECTTGRVTESYSAQMVWRFNPNGICSEFAEDWTRIAKHPFLISSVSRESVSKKGKLQAIDLSDVATLMPVFRQDRGSLVGPHTSHRDLAVLIPRAIETALHDRRIVPDGQAALCEAWERFRCSYETAVTECFAEGVSSPACLELESTYSHLLESLIHHAPGDGNRKHLWEPILQLGIAVVGGHATGGHRRSMASVAALRNGGEAPSGVRAGQLSADGGNGGLRRCEVFFDDLSEEKILEGSENDADSFVASEASRDFMARLRIGIMADSAPIPSARRSAHRHCLPPGRHRSASRPGLAYRTERRAGAGDAAPRAAPLFPPSAGDNRRPALRSCI